MDIGGVPHTSIEDIEDYMIIVYIVYILQSAVISSWLWQLTGVIEFFTS